MPEPAHVLVVEDSRAQRMLICEILRADGHRVTEARDGTEAQALAASQRFDLVLTDFEMPGLDGMELTRRLREREDYRAVPIVIMSARSDLDSRVNGLATGAHDYLAKPLAQREVVARVRSLLALARSQRELERCQARLVATEKLAFAAKMAGGILHEANSPLQALGLNLSALADMCQQLVDAIPPDARADVDLDMTCEDVPRIVASCAGAVERLQRTIASFRQLEGISAESRGVHDADLRETIARAVETAGAEASLPDAPLPTVLGHQEVESHVVMLLAHVRAAHGRVAIRLSPERRLEISAPVAVGTVDLVGPEFTSDGRMRFDMSASAAREALVRLGAHVDTAGGTLAITFPTRQE